MFVNKVRYHYFCPLTYWSKKCHIFCSPECRLVIICLKCTLVMTTVLAICSSDGHSRSEGKLSTASGVGNIVEHTIGGEICFDIELHQIFHVHQHKFPFMFHHCKSKFKGPFTSGFNTDASWIALVQEFELSANTHLPTDKMSQQ